MIFHHLLCFILPLFVQIASFSSGYESTLKKNPIHLRDHAFESDILIEAYNQASGLPIDALTSVAWGNDNKIYCTTYDGFVRFNGSKFEIFNTASDSGFITDKIYRQLHTKKKQVWLLDEENELVEWNDDTSVRISRAQGLPNIMVHEMKEDENGEVWLGTEYGIFKQKMNENFKQFNRDLRLIVWNLQPIDSYTAIAMTNQGLFLVTELQLINLLSSDDPIFGNDKRVRITQLKNGDYFIACSSGFAHFSSENHLLHKQIMNTTVYEVIEDPNQSNEFILRTMERFHFYNAEKKEIQIAESIPIKGGNFISNKSTWLGDFLYVGDYDIYHRNRVIFSTPNQSQIQNVIQDESGALWVATNGDGLFKVQYSKFKTLDFKDADISFNTYSIQRTNNSRILFSTMTTGVLEWGNGELNQLLISSHDPSVRVDSRVVTSGSDNVTYVSFWGNGVWSINNSKVKRLFPNDHIINDQNSVTDYIYDDEQHLWIGNLGGFFKYNKVNNELAEIKDSLGFPLTKVRVIRRLTQDTLIVGTTGNGVYKISTLSNFSFQLPYEKTGRYIRDIHVKNDTIWFGTEDNGLIRYLSKTKNVQQQFKIFHYPEIKKDWAVHRILEDRVGFWWFTNNQGLYRVKKTELDLLLDEKIEQTKLIYFTEKDGLPTREFNGGTQNAGIVDEKGNFWLPTIRGLIHFNPSDFVPFDTLQPILQFVSAETNLNRKIKLDDLSKPILLSANERDMIITYEIIDYQRPNTYTFSYQTDSKYEQWIQHDKNYSIRLTNLTDGEQSITVKLNNQYSFSPAFATLEFVVEPYFYETPLFFSLLFGLVFSSISFISWNLLKKKKQREEELLHDIGEQNLQILKQKEENEQVLQLFNRQHSELEQLNLQNQTQLVQFSHDIRTPLQLIRGPIELILEELKKGEFAYLQKNISLLERYYHELVNYSNQLIETVQLKMEDEPQSTLFDSIESNKPQTNHQIDVIEDFGKAKKPKILVIDDIEDIRLYLSMSLEQDFMIKTADNGKNGLEILNQFKPDIILCDVMMPEMDGFEFAHHLYANPNNESIPLVFLTAKDSEEDRFKGLQAGAIAYLTKPIQTNVLKAQVNSLLKREIHIKTEIPKSNELSHFMKRINELIYRHINNTDLSLDSLSEAMHMSKSTLYRKWKEESEETLANYILEIRLKETLKLVQEQQVSFAEASSLCGFNNPSYFSRAFRKVYGCTPSEYKEKMN